MIDGIPLHKLTDRDDIEKRKFFKEELSSTSPPLQTAFRFRGRRA